MDIKVDIKNNDKESIKDISIEKVERANNPDCEVQQSTPVARHCEQFVNKKVFNEEVMGKILYEKEKEIEK